jgi:hypothetical protein
MFPDKRLIKTYDALWESFRSIAPLQLLFLEIFEYVDTFWSYGVLKAGSRNLNGRRRRGHRATARASTFWHCHASNRAFTGVRTLHVQRYGPKAPQWSPCPNDSSCAAFTHPSVPGRATRLCACVPAHGLRMQPASRGHSRPRRTHVDPAPSSPFSSLIRLRTYRAPAERSRAPPPPVPG